MRYADGDGLTAKGRRRREAARLEAAGLFAKEVAPSEVARRLRVSSKPAYQWHEAWRGGGTAALTSRELLADLHHLRHRRRTPPAGPEPHPR
ncbi:helix-turn-helix domain-containing protein [Streptomyces sp. BK340]|uniref:helix-turn-helix domain-containing protein n=1 Tax=Streptomyces sp. BK340 TaxID=2572903 RepID=UPI0037D9D468